MLLPEYTILTFLALFLAVILDVWIFKTKLFFQKKFWIFLLVVAFLQTIVDNWLNGRWWLDSYIVGPYGDAYYLGIKIWNTPIENYFYGFGLITMVVSFFEFLKKRFSANKKEG
jgi:lycopene cyclase domain-containing protein